MRFPPVYVVYSKPRGFLLCAASLILFSTGIYGQAEPMNYTTPLPDGNTTQSPAVLKDVQINATLNYLPNNRSSGNDSFSVPPPQKPPPALGLHCSDHSQCRANFSSCVNQTCTCQPGYVSSSQNLRCLTVVSKMGGDCSEDEQCRVGLASQVGPTTCLNFICSCDIGMSLLDGKCQGPTVLNSNCSSDDDCSIEKSNCMDGVCSCLPGFVPNSEINLCLPVNVKLLKLSDAVSSGCTEDVQCQKSMGDDAVCTVSLSGGVCECMPGTHLLRATCMPYKNLGDSCSYDDDCLSKDVNMEEDSSRICNQNVCSCNTGWTRRGNVCSGSGSALAASAALLFATLCLLMRQ